MIRRATPDDLAGINRLLKQVLMVHHRGRPDLFKADVKKYTDEELLAIIADDKRPIFVYSDDDDRATPAGTILGYAFCIYQEHPEDNILTENASLYIDDLCVDENQRGRHIGRQLYDHVIDFARKEGFYNVTLNVWTCNEPAMKFYESCGLVAQKIGMEQIL